MGFSSRPAQASALWSSCSFCAGAPWPGEASAPLFLHAARGKSNICLVMTHSRVAAASSSCSLSCSSKFSEPELTMALKTYLSLDTLGAAKSVISKLGIKGQSYGPRYISTLKQNERMVGVKLRSASSS